MGELVVKATEAVGLGCPVSHESKRTQHIVELNSFRRQFNEISSENEIFRETLKQAGSDDFVLVAQ